MTFNITVPKIRIHVKSRRPQPVHPHTINDNIGKRIAYVNRDGWRCEGDVTGWQYDMAGVLSYTVRNADGLQDYVSSWNFLGVAQ